MVAVDKGLVRLYISLSHSFQLGIVTWKSNLCFLGGWNLSGKYVGPWSIEVQLGGTGVDGWLWVGRSEWDGLTVLYLAMFPTDNNLCISIIALQNLTYGVHPGPSPVPPFYDLDFLFHRYIRYNIVYCVGYGKMYYFVRMIRTYFGMIVSS